MEQLNNDLLIRIFKFLPNPRDLLRLASVSARLNRVSADEALWYEVFLHLYADWGHHIRRAALHSSPLIGWRDYVLHLAKQKKQLRALSFEFVPDRFNEPQRLGKRRLSHQSDQGESESSPQKWLNAQNRLRRITNEATLPSGILAPPFRIQDPLVVDIDHVTNTGIVATGKHRKERAYQVSGRKRSEHKILFWDYPSWRLVRELDLSLTPAEMSCQIVGIQSIHVKTEKGVEKIRLFALALGVPLFPSSDPDGEDRVDRWHALLIYRLYDDGATQCLAHINMYDAEIMFLGREIFFFSDASWAQSNDGAWQPDPTANSLRDWIRIVAPTHADYDPHYSLFVLAIGPTFPRVNGCGHLIRFDIRGQADVRDPSVLPIRWEPSLQQFIEVLSTDPLSWQIPSQSSGIPASVITTVQLGTEISCMIHFRYPPQLNHLICTGSYQDDELSIYDWRFGVKVGTLPWNTRAQKPLARASEDSESVIADRRRRPRFSRHHSDLLDDDNHARHGIHDGEEEDILEALLWEEGEEGEEDQEEDEDAMDVDRHFMRVVRPWGLESTMVVPPNMAADSKMPSREDLALRGFRLIAVGDNREDKLEIKVWDISYLLLRDWDPLQDVEEDAQEPKEDVQDQLLERQFGWWHRGTSRLRRLGRCMLPGESGRAGFAATTNGLPFSPAVEDEAMILSHSFTRNKKTTMPIKYAAYNVLSTMLFLLTEDGHITVMDIESGEVTKTVSNVAALQGAAGPHRRVTGIDVNVIGGREVVVTSREGLLRCVIAT